jgi:hypothetical protein
MNQLIIITLLCDSLYLLCDSLCMFFFVTQSPYSNREHRGSQRKFIEM